MVGTGHIFWAFEVPFGPVFLGGNSLGCFLENTKREALRWMTVLVKHANLNCKFYGSEALVFFKKWEEPVGFWDFYRSVIGRCDHITSEYTYMCISNTHTHICVYLSTHVEIYLQTHIHKYHSGEKHIYVYKCVVFLFHDLSMIYPLIYSKTFFSFCWAGWVPQIHFYFLLAMSRRNWRHKQRLDLTRTMNTTRNLVKESIC